MTQYLILQDFGKIGREWTGDPERTAATLVDDILTGQLISVEKIWEVEEDGAPAINITEDVARAVRDRLINEQHDVTYDMANWLHVQLGVGSIPWPAAAE